MQSNGNAMTTKRRTLDLDTARVQTPAPDPVEAMRRQCAVAAYGAVKDADVEAMVTRLKELAMGGDLKAMRMYLEMIGTIGKHQVASQPPAESAGLSMVAGALRDLVDEVRLNRAVEERRKELGYEQGDGSS